MKNIAIVGLGGVGGYFGGKICQLAQEKDASYRVYFVARGKHLEAIQAHGLRLETKEEGPLFCHPTLATGDIAELPPLDICFICVKQYDLLPTLRSLAPKIGPQTKIIALLNGMDIHQRIRTVLDRGIVYPACVYVLSNIKEPGTVVQNGGTCRIIFGNDPQHPEADAQELCELLGLAKIDFIYSPNPLEAIWTKYLFIASFALLTAGHDKTMGEILQGAETRKELTAVMEEIVMLARAEGVQLAADIVQTTLLKTAPAFPFSARTSFQRDFAAGRKDERELFGPALFRLAEKHQLAIPALRGAYARIETAKPFRKMVVLDHVDFFADGRAALANLAEEVVYYEDQDPVPPAQIVQRAQEADVVLLSLRTPFREAEIAQCPHLRYIGMCCSLYNPESANVDIRAANARGIVVKGIRDYGDMGVVEFILSELAYAAHGWGRYAGLHPGLQHELSEMKVGIIGMGTVGKLTARFLRYFNADVRYFNRSRKPEIEALGVQYMELHPLLAEVDACITCLNKNTILLHAAEFAQFGNGKLLINISIGPSFDVEALRAWLQQDANNFFACDMEGGIGNQALAQLPNASCLFQSSGMTEQAKRNLNTKVIQNIHDFLAGK